MDSYNLEPLNIHANARKVDDYTEVFEIFRLKCEWLDSEKKTTHLLAFVGNVKNLTFPKTPVLCLLVRWNIW